jgi:hypothetical protein
VRSGANSGVVLSPLAGITPAPCGSRNQTTSRLASPTVNDASESPGAGEWAEGIDSPCRSTPVSSGHSGTRRESEMGLRNPELGRTEGGLASKIYLVCEVVGPRLTRLTVGTAQYSSAQRASCRGRRTHLSARRHSPLAGSALPGWRWTYFGNIPSDDVVCAISRRHRTGRW